MSDSINDPAEPAGIDERFGVLAKGKPLGRAVWTASRELAEDMMTKASPGEPLEFWRAELVRQSTGEEVRSVEIRERGRQPEDQDLHPPPLASDMDVLR